MEFHWLVFTTFGTINVGKNATSIISKEMNLIMVIFDNVPTALGEGNTKIESRGTIKIMNG